LTIQAHNDIVWLSVTDVMNLAVHLQIMVFVMAGLAARWQGSLSGAYFYIRASNLLISAIITYNSIMILINMLLSEPQLKKAEFSIVVTLSGIVRFFKERFSANALTPIVVTPSGIVIFLSETQ